MSLTWDPGANVHLFVSLTPALPADSAWPPAHSPTLSAECSQEPHLIQISHFLISLSAKTYPPLSFLDFTLLYTE